MDIPLNPVGKEEIRKLEGALLLMAIFNKETLENLIDPTKRITWIDSLYVAAAALAREKAGMSISQIANELGVTDMTIRKHLKGETKAGEIILKVYERLKNEGFKLEFPIEGFDKEVNELKEKLDLVKKTLTDLLNKIQ